MPNQPRPGDAPLNIRGPKQLWADFAKACAARGVSRNQRLIDHARADVEQWRAEQGDDRMADDVRRHLPPPTNGPPVCGPKKTDPPAGAWAGFHRPGE